MIGKIKAIVKRFLGIKNPNSIGQLVKNGLKVGVNFNLQNDCIIDASHCWHITIGDHVTIAPRVHILAHDASTYNYLGYTKVSNTAIGNNVFIGAGSIILPGVSIGNNVIIGAGSVVTKDLLEDGVYAGNPAKYICETQSYIAKQKKKMNELNTFPEKYSRNTNISSTMKKEMVKVVKEYGICFLK